MKQVLIRQGMAVVEEVPAPIVEPNTVLVQVDRSCISIGTEMSGIKISNTPLWKRAIRQPEKLQACSRYGCNSGGGAYCQRYQR